MRKKTACAASIVMALVLCGAAAVQAQVQHIGSAPERPELAVPFLLPSGVRCTIDPRFEWRLQYEDNVENAVRDETGDFSNRYSPSLQTIVSSEVVTVSGRTKLDIIEYLDEQYLNSVDQDHGIDITWEPHERMQIFVSGSYTASTDPDRFFERDDISGVGDYAVTRTKQKTKMGMLGLACDLSPRSVLTAMGMWSNFETASTSDSDMYNAQAQYLYHLTPRTSANITGTYSTFDFAFDGDLSTRDRDFFEDLIGSGDFDLLFGSKYKTNTYTVSAGFDHSFSRHFRLSASLGWRYTKNDSTSESEDVESGETVINRKRNSGDGVIFDLTLEKEFKRTRCMLSANHNVGTNPDTGESYEATRVLCSVTHPFTGQLRGSASVQFRHNESDPSDEFPSVTDRDLYTVYAQLSYACRQWMDISLGYRFYRNDNKLSSRKVDRNTIFGTITLKPLRPMVLW